MTGIATLVQQQFTELNSNEGHEVQRVGETSPYQLPCIVDMPMDQDGETQGQTK